MKDESTVIWFGGWDIKEDHAWGFCYDCGSYVDYLEAVCCPVCGKIFDHMIAHMASGK